jgi:hypothetical protein
MGQGFGAYKAPLLFTSSPFHLFTCSSFRLLNFHVFEDRIVDAERMNAVANQLADLDQRAAELRRYL